MTNVEIIKLVMANMLHNAPAPTGNDWYLTFPKSFQKTVDDNFSKFLKKDETYHIMGNVIKIVCEEY